MTTPKLFNRPTNVVQRASQLWRRVFAPGDLTALLITGVLLLMVAYSLEASDWPLAMNTVVPVVLISVFFGFVLARSRYDELFSLILGTLYGIITVFVVTAINEPGGLLDGTASVIGRTVLWVYDAATGGINPDSLVFTMLVSSLFWYLGYNAAWHIFRIDRVWRVVLPPALIMLTNMVVYSGNADLDLYLIVFLFMALLLVVRSHLDAREWDWYASGIRVPMRLRAQFLRAGSVLAFIALLIAFAIPNDDVQERLSNFQRFLESDPIRQFSELWNRLFEPIETEGPATADYYGGDSLSLGGAIRLGEQSVFYVQAPADQRYYWRSRVFERYDNGRWSPSATHRVPDSTPPTELTLNAEIIGAARQRATHTFTIAMPGTRILYSAPQPESVSVAGRIDVSRTMPMLEAASPMNVSVMRPWQVLTRGESYQATSLMSVATAFELRAADTTYPEWVRNPNAAPGMSVSFRTIELGRFIVEQAGATNPYDQAKAIESWLRTNIEYNESIGAPPDGVDPVDWVLFDTREGYCTYYATAMISMLRGLGIPARMAAGFSQGEWDDEAGHFVVRERDAHTWVEVYFPGYGWVEFEPTANQAPLTRVGDDPVAPAQAVAAPPTPAPTNTPTPVPSPTPLPTNTPQAQAATPTPQPAEPTITPTPSATPTATPVIVPTVPPEMEQPPPQDFVSALLSAFGLALLLLIALVLLVVVLLVLWWWWEWRGLGGFTPVTRAYARLERFLPLAGIRTSDEQTTEERRQHIVDQLPKAEQPITAISRLYTHERYSRQRPSSPDTAQNGQVADEAWPPIRRNILWRWLRRLLPGGRR